MVQVAISEVDVKKLSNTVILFAEDKGKLTKAGAAFDKAHKGAVSAALTNSRFQGGKGETFIVTLGGGDVPMAVVVGLGSFVKAEHTCFRKAGIDASQTIDRLGVTESTVIVEETKKVTAEKAAETFLEGFELGIYRFDQFKHKMKDHQKSKFKKLSVQIAADAGKAFKKMLPLVQAQTEGANLARDLVNLPPNIANPDYMVAEAKKMAKLGLKVTILGEKELAKLNMNLMLAVGRASKQESRLIIMEWMGDKKTKDVEAIVGKGVMFDTGGYNLKPGASMTNMKGDMGGAAAVMGAMMALAKRKAKANVIGVCGCVMNMIDGDGFLPDSVITGYSGQSVEIGNTDAEGRLVLADAMSYIIDKKKPKRIIDLATLTGACMVALGGHYGGLFSNDDKLAKALDESGQDVSERLWRLPIDDGYAAKTSVADLNNDGSRWGGASTAAVFLKSFVGTTPWAHLDIAGVALGEKIPGVQQLNGASGFGVRLLVNYLDKR